MIPEAGLSETDAGTSGSIGLPGLDTPCLGGPTARDVLTLLEPSYSSTFTGEAPPAGYSSSVSLVPTALTVTAKYSGGEITCTPGHCDCDAPPPGYSCPPCTAPPTIHVALDVTFETADGAFAEQFTGIAYYIKLSGGLVDIFATEPTAQFKGTFPRILGPEEDLSYLISLTGPKTTGVVSEVTATVSLGGGHWGY